MSSCLKKSTKILQCVSDKCISFAKKEITTPHYKIKTKRTHHLSSHIWLGFLRLECMLNLLRIPDENPSLD